MAQVVSKSTIVMKLDISTKQLYLKCWLQLSVGDFLDPRSLLLRFSAVLHQDRDQRNLSVLDCECLQIRCLLARLEELPEIVTERNVKIDIKQAIICAAFAWQQKCSSQTIKISRY